MSKRYRWQELDKKPTICSSAGDQLKIEDKEKGYRVWLYPFNHRISIEQRIRGTWIVTESWYPHEDE